MRRTASVVTLVLAALLLGGCAAEDRPEGTVERWLISLNQGASGEPQRYAPDAVSQRVLPGWEACEPNALDVIEVGRGQVARAPSGVETALVPYRLEYAGDLADLCPSAPAPDAPTEGTAELRRFAGSATWQVQGLAPLDPALRVPSEGGQRVGSATGLDWLLGLAIAMTLIGLVALLMAAQPTPRPIPSDVSSEPDARGF